MGVRQRMEDTLLVCTQIAVGEATLKYGTDLDTHNDRAQSFSDAPGVRDWQGRRESSFDFAYPPPPPPLWRCDFALPYLSYQHLLAMIGALEMLVAGQAGQPLSKGIPPERQQSPQPRSKKDSRATNYKAERRMGFNQDDSEHEAYIPSVFDGSGDNLASIIAAVRETDRKDALRTLGQRYLQSYCQTMRLIILHMQRINTSISWYLEESRGERTQAEA